MRRRRAGSRGSELWLETPRLVVTLPPPEAAWRVVDYYRRNQAFHKQWDPPRPAAFYEEEWWAERLAASRLEYARDCSCRLFSFHRDDPQGGVVGSMNFTSFARGPFQACRLGYSVDQAHEGQGLMREALEAAIGHMFEDLGFHRIEANYIPINQRSGNLLRRLGFVIEGTARDYLFIDGAWRDHVLTSRTNPDAPLPPGA